MTAHIPDSSPADTADAPTAVPATATGLSAGTPEPDTAGHITVEGFDSLVPAVIDLDAPRDGVPLVIETRAGLERCAAALAAGHGPAGVDAERASGFRYG